MKVPSNIRKTALVAAVTLAITGIPTLDNDFNLQVGFSSVISSAYAAQGAGSGGGHKGAMGGQKGGQSEERGQGSQGYKGGKSISEVLADDDGDDSDRPDHAGVPGRDGKPGRPNAGGDNQKGGEYGDLFVILRDEDGNAVTDENGEFYILLTNGEWVLTVDGEVPADSAALAEPVEFGRMNIARSPESVIEHSLVEALSKLDGLVIDAENIDENTDPMGRLTADGLTIDSPLESLALYEALLTAEVNDDGMLVLEATSSHDGADTTYTMLVDPEVRLDLAASAIAASSDKTGFLTLDEIVLISSFMGVDDELASLTDSYTYDRNSTYDQVITVALPVDDGDPTTVDPKVPQEVDLDVFLESGYTYDNVTYEFNEIAVPVINPDGTYSYSTDLSGVYIFTQAADDAVQVLEFIHEFE